MDGGKGRKGEKKKQIPADTCRSVRAQMERTVKRERERERANTN